MARIVAKFGGTSVADIERIEKAAEKIAEEHKRGNEVAVVVSAMSGVTNELVEYCRSISRMHDLREYDVVVSSGEQVTAGLMALALQKKGIPARSWLGWQLPIQCNDHHGSARIQDICVKELEERFKDRNEVAVLAGFQGISSQGRLATLGRGGSDTSAVVLAAGLKAERCDIYTDVNGVYTTDPRIVKKARRLKIVSYEEMLEMASLGAKVLQTRSVEMAMKNNIALQVLSSFEEPIGSDFPGTLVTKEEDIVEEHVVNGITYEKNEAKITLRNVANKPGVSAGIFGPLAKANINVDMIVQTGSAQGELADMIFTVKEQDLQRTLEALEGVDTLEGAEIMTDKDVIKLSVVGIGMRSHPGVAQQMFASLAEKNINILAISTSEIKVSVLISKEYLELAIRTLHTSYGLDEAA